MLIGGGAVSLLGITLGTLWYLHRQDIHRWELQTVARDMRCDSAKARSYGFLSISARAAATAPQPPSSALGLMPYCNRR